MILVTGASGLLGANLVRALLERGARVRCMVHRDRRALEGLEVEIIEGDIRNSQLVVQATKGIELVYHLAGLISLDGDWDQLEAVNVRGVRNVVHACLENGVRRLLHFSSIHAISGEPFDRPVSEINPRVDGTHQAAYDRSKAAGEAEVSAGIVQGLDAVILNPTGVIGPLDFKPSMFGQAVIMIARGVFPVLVQGGFNWVDARDVTECALLAAEQAPPGGQYIIGGEWRSVKDIAVVVAGMFGGRPPYLYAPLWMASMSLPLSAAYSRLAGKRNIFTQLTLDALSSNPNVDDSLARRELGYSPRPFEETIRDAVKWFADQEMLPMPPKMKGVFND
jgi:dihydroflavonol-4-reductase